MYKSHTTCRACGYAAPPYPGKSAPSGESLIKVFDLGLQPLANDFCNASDSRSGFAPLEVLFCPRCTLAQLSVVVDPEILYLKYKYLTSQSETMRIHFDMLWEGLNLLGSCQRIVEVGSNDGLFLAHCKARGAENVLGIDPAKNLVKLAAERWVPTLSCSFDAEAARMASDAVPICDLVVARHVFCHIDDWKSFVHNLAVLCSKHTLVYIEVPYVMDLINNGEFDTVYHEHTSYLSIRSLQALLSGSPLYLKQILRFSIHGGAIGLILKLRPETDVHESVDEHLRGEAGYTAIRWQDFASLAHAKIHALRSMLETRADGKTLTVGYGASAKSTVWVNACGLNRRHLNFITDNTPYKQYKFSPGSNIPIVDEGALTRELPQYAVCFAWNYAEEIMKKEKLFKEKGGRWIIPHPEVRVL